MASCIFSASHFFLTYTFLLLIHTLFLPSNSWHHIFFPHFLSPPPSFFFGLDFHDFSCLNPPLLICLLIHALIYKPVAYVSFCLAYYPLTLFLPRNSWLRVFFLPPFFFLTNTNLPLIYSNFLLCNSSLHMFSPLLPSLFLLITLISPY